MLSYLFRDRRRRLKSHFLFDVGGEAIAYCYIRKNACSAFKRMILDQSGYDGEWKDSIDFLFKHRSAPTLEAVRRCRWRIFVYRDPFDRAASLFRNKMVMQDGAVDLLRNYSAVTRSDPADSTFAGFVADYLTKRGLDPHARSQSNHLLPVDYNCVSTLETLYTDMREIVGETLASRYFKSPTNASSARLSDEPSAATPVRILRQRFAASGQLPSTESLRTPQIESVIRQIYSDDYSLRPRRPA